VDGTVIKRELPWGKKGDIPLLGDVDGDGVEELVIFRKASDEWFATKVNGTVLFRGVKWGDPAVSGNGPIVPMVQDMNGDAKGNLVVYRPQSGRWSAAGRRYALGYATKDHDGPGAPRADILEPPGCYAQGGYWFSSIEYISWASMFGHGSTFVSQSVRDMLFDPTSATSRGNRLSWALVFDTQEQGFSFVFEKYGIRYLPWHDGADRGFTSAFIQLPDGYYAFGTVNSSERSAEQIARGLLRAWIAAMGGNENQGG
jgi:hypothetical protein